MNRKTQHMKHEESSMLKPLLSQVLFAALASIWLFLPGRLPAQPPESSSGRRRSGDSSPPGASYFSAYGQPGGGAPAPSSSSRNTGKSPMTGQAFFQEDPETGSLIVITDDETNKQIQTVIQSLDRPVPQALIKVLFLEITHTDDLDIGTEATIKNDSTNNPKSVTSLYGLAADLAARNSGTYFKVIQDDLDMTIKALASVSKLEVLSRPSVLARNNVEAIITVGQEVPFIRNSRITADGQTLNTIEYDDIGIILRVTPHITSRGMIELDVNPEISTLTGDSVKITDTVTAPVFAKRSAVTTVVVPDGKTVVIGGLMEDRTVNSVEKFPILGDIPLMGVLFSRTIKSKAKTELLIFLTPHLVGQLTELADLSTSETNKAVMIPQTFNRQTLDRFDGTASPPETDNESDSKAVERRYRAVQ